MVRGRALLVFLPLLVIGSEAGHALLGFLAPRSYQGAELFEGGSAGQRLLPYAIALAVALIVAGLLAAPERGRHPHRLRLGLAALPLVVFTVQEQVEYLIGRGHVAWGLPAHAAFAIGLALQFPFSLLAYLLGRMLFVLADAVALRLGAGRARLDLRPLAPSVSGASRSRRGRPSRDARFTRGPPQPISV